MPTSDDIAQYKGLLDKAQLLVADYQRVLKIRTQERDALLGASGNTATVVQLGPSIIVKERKEAANAAIKLAMERLRQTVGHNAYSQIHLVLRELLHEKPRKGPK